VSLTVYHLSDGSGPRQTAPSPAAATP
jgi:hypothetical protein